jgi:CheY-like chemotaxis protein
VLVVDDNEVNRAVVADTLTPLGFEVVDAADGCRGFEKAKARRPDLILMDVVMPEIDGLEAIRRLRREPACRDIPIIAVSASASGKDAAKSLAAGANAFLTKPLDLEALLAQIAAQLQLDRICGPQEPAGASAPAAAEPLVTPPAQDMETLLRLAREGNMRSITQQAARLITLDQRYRPFADQLQALAEGYQSDAILRLIESGLGSKEALP